MEEGGYMWLMVTESMQGSYYSPCEGFCQVTMLYCPPYLSLRMTPTSLFTYTRHVPLNCG